ncbi:MAG TPA: BamA/TamA family outer membrane protein [Planctomycetota bacterium]|nr:BamA/TamA family outer membrane protein [Planctomycetota bacterium]
MTSRGAVRAAVFLSVALWIRRLPAADEPRTGAKVRFELEGEDGLSERDLRNALSALESDLKSQGVDAGAADDAAYELVRFYRSQGYLRAAVAAEWPFEEDPDLVLLRIAEGPRSHVVDLVLEGNVLFTAADLATCFPWPRSGLFGLGENVFTQEALDSGLECLTARYQLEGCFFMEADPAFSVDPNGDVHVRVLIREGPKILLDLPLRFEGVTSLSVRLLEEHLDLPRTTFYTPRLPLVLKGKLVEFYRNLGYRFIDIDVDREIDPETRKATLIFRVNEGALTKIEDVRLSGNKATWDWVLLSRLHLRAGDLYSEESIRRSYRSLLRSGLFSSISLETPPVEGAADRVHLDVSVKEKARFKAAILVGYGSYEYGRAGVSLEDVNLFGTGHRLRLTGSGSFRGESVKADYLNPYFFDDRVGHNIQTLYERREHPSFVERRYSGETGLTYRVSDEVRTNLVYRLKQSTLLDAKEAVPEELVEDVLISSVALSGIFDNRNSVIDPTSGITARLTVEYSGTSLGSDLDFIRWNAFASHVIEGPFETRFVTAVRAGAIRRLPDTDVIPIQERFFNGGESTVRSFPEDEAGPLIGGEPIGGEAFTVYNVELRVPLGFLEGLQAALFFDVGTLTERAEDLGGGRYFLGVGTGIRYNTPIGPFRFDAAFNPDRQGDENSFAFHVGLGYPF